MGTISMVRLTRLSKILGLFLSRDAAENTALARREKRLKKRRSLCGALREDQVSAALRKKNETRFRLTEHPTVEIDRYSDDEGSDLEEDDADELREGAHFIWLVKDLA